MVATAGLLVDGAELIQQTLQVIPADTLFDPKILLAVNIAVPVLIIWLRGLRNRVENRIA